MAQLIKEMQLDSNVRSKINSSLKIRKDGMKCFKGDEILFAFKNKVYICIVKNDGILGKGFSKEISNIGDYFTDGEVSFEVKNIYNSSEIVENVNSVWDLFKIENPKEDVTYRTLTESNYPQEFINNYITEDKHSFTVDEGNKYEYAFNLLIDYGSEEVKKRINRASMASTFVNKFQTKDGIDVPLEGYAFLMHNGKCCFCGKYTDSDGYPLAMDEIISGSLRAEFSTDEIAHDEIYICPSYDSDFYTYPIEYVDTKLKSQPFEGVTKEIQEHGIGLKWYHWTLEKETFVGEIFEIKNINERLERLYNNEQPAKFTLYMVETEHDFDFPYAIGQKLDERDKDLAYIKQTLNECGITAPLQESIDFYISMKPFKDYDRVKSETDGEIVFSNKNGLQDYHFGAGSEFTFTNGKWIKRTKIENSKHLNENKIPTLAEALKNSDLTTFNSILKDEDLYCLKECMATKFNKKECSTIIVDGNNQGVKHYIKDNRFIAYNYNDGSGKVVFHDARDSNIDKELPQHCSYLEFENVYNTDYFNYRNYHINNGSNRYDNMLNVDVVDFLKCGKEELPHLWKVKKIRVNKDNFPHFVSNEQKHKNVINKMRNYLCPLLKTVEISSKQEYDENESCSSINFDVPYNTKHTYILLKEDTSYQFKSIGVASRDNKFGGLDYRFASNLRNVKDVANAAISYLNNSSSNSFGQFGAKIICDATEATKTLTMETENGGQNFVVQKGNIVIQASPDLIGIIFSAKGGDGWYDFDNEAEDYCNYQIIGMKID